MENKSCNFLIFGNVLCVQVVEFLYLINCNPGFSSVNQCLLSVYSLNKRFGANCICRVMPMYRGLSCRSDWLTSSDHRDRHYGM